VFYGEIANKHVADLKDLSRREFLILATLAVMVIGLGVYPKIITDFTHVSATQWLGHMATSKLPVAGL
jgi:NADH-quinone oxidoreductase subunit M